MIRLLFLLLALPSLEASGTATVLAVRGPEGSVGELRAWAEYAPAGLALTPTQLREDGRWQVHPPDSPAPPHTLWARSKGTAFVAVPWPPSLQLQLPPPGTLQLTLHCPDPRHPLRARVLVRLRWTPFPDAQAREVPGEAYTLRWAAADGTLRLEGLPFGPGQRYDLELSSPGYAPAQLSRVDLWTSERHLGKVELHPAGRLCGTVHIPDGVAEHEEVEAQLSWAEQRRRVRPDADGTFCFPDSPVGVLATVRAASRFRAGTPVEVRAPADEVALALPVLDVLAGEVVTADGAPVGDCHLSIAPDPGFEPPPELSLLLSAQRLQVSCQGGRFRTPRPWPGTPLLVEVTAPPFPPARLPIPEGASGEELRVVLSAGQRVEGRVREADQGAAVEGARVTLTCPGATPIESHTDADGSFTLSGVSPAATCQGRVDHPHFPAVRETVSTNAEQPTRWEVRLRAGIRASGVILAQPHGEPVAGALVRFMGPDEVRLTTTSDRQGRFLSDPLAGGAWTILVEREGFLAATAELALTPPVEPPPLTLWLERGLEVWGTVEGLTPPAQGAVVTLASDGARHTRTTTGYGGVFRARGPAGGWTRFAVRHHSLATPCAGKVWISPESPGPVTLACAPPSVSLHLRLRQASGQLAPSTALLVVGMDASYRTYLCEVENGEACQVHLTPGTYRVLFSDGRKVEQLWQGPVLSDRHLLLLLPAPAP